MWARTAASRLHWKMKREYGKIAVALTVQVVMLIIVIMGAMRAM